MNHFETKQTSSMPRLGCVSANLAYTGSVSRSLDLLQKNVLAESPSRNENQSSISLFPDGQRRTVGTVRITEPNVRCNTRLAHLGRHRMSLSPFSDMFNSETTGPIEVHTESPWIGGKCCIHGTVVAGPKWLPFPYMVKTFKKSSSSELGTQDYQVCSNDDPRLIFELFTQMLKLVPYAFVLEKAYIIKTVAVHDVDIGVYCKLNEYMNISMCLR